MRAINKKGFIKSIGKGHKAVGETLENILGIKPNSSKNPDYKGIELKSSTNLKNRSTLFSQVPNWKLSRLKNTLEILKERGIYSEEDSRLTLYHTIKSGAVNSYNMSLKVNIKKGLLEQNHIKNSVETKDVVWLLEDLKLQFGIKVALISQSIVFSLAHIGFKMPFWNTLGILLGLFTLGILCSIIRLKDEGSLWGAIGLHGGLVGIWFVLNNGLINISKEAPNWLVGYGAANTNPLGGLYGISLLIISCIFYFLKFKNQIFKFIK